MTKRKRFLALLAGIVAAAILVAAEALVSRFFAPPQAPPVLGAFANPHCLKEISAAFWEFRPNTTALDDRLNLKYQINSLKLRGPETKLHKTEGCFRIITLGDSSIFGLRSEIPLNEFIENKLNRMQQEKLHYQAWNGGIPGTTSQQGVIFLQRRLDELNPDLIIISYGWNDAGPAAQRGYTDRELYHMSRKFAYRVRYFVSKSGIFRLLESWLKGKWNPPPILQQKKGPSWSSVLVRSTVSHLVNEPDPMIDYLKENEILLRVNPLEYKQNVETMLDLCEKKDISIILAPVSVPHIYISECRKIENSRFFIAETERRLWNNYKKNNAADVSPISMHEKSALFADMCHPTPEGHEIIADAVIELMQDSGLIL